MFMIWKLRGLFFQKLSQTPPLPFRHSIWMRVEVISSFGRLDTLEYTCQSASGLRMLVPERLARCGNTVEYVLPAYYVVLQTSLKFPQVIVVLVKIVKFMPCMPKHLSKCIYSWPLGRFTQWGKSRLEWRIGLTKKAPKTISSKLLPPPSDLFQMIYYS